MSFRFFKIFAVIYFCFSGLSLAVPSPAASTERALLHYRLGDIYHAHGFHAEAEREFSKALELLADASAKGSKDQMDIMPPAKLESAPSAPAYIIAEGDVLDISVWENSDLDREVIVRPDGMISYPLIGEVRAAGITIPALSESLTGRLKEYLRFPDVSICLKKIGGSKILVLGQVRHPGVYALTGNRTVLEAVALAGGFTEDSVASSVIVIKGGLENPEGSRINLTRALHNPQHRENIALEPEDIVFVPKKFISNVSWALKQILEPISRGAYTSRALMSF